MSRTSPEPRRLTLAGRLCLLTAVALGALAPGAALAQDEAGDAPAAGEPPSFAVQPSGPDGPGARDWFTYTLDPGDQFGDTVAISNLSEEPIRFTIHATDAVTVDDVAGFGALRIDEEPTDVGTWIELAAEEYTVEPGKRIDVPFSITVPDDAEPGDHAGAILAFDADATIDPAEAPEGLSLDVRYRLGARVYVRVGGDVAPALRVDDLAVQRDGGSATVTWNVVNTGNLRLTPEVEVRITGFLGRTVKTVPIQELPELLPGANFVGGSNVNGLPTNERLTAHVIARAEGVETERTIGFGSYPWLLLGGLVVLLAALAWFLRRRRARRRGGNAGPPPSPRVREPVSV